MPEQVAVEITNYKQSSFLSAASLARNSFCNAFDNYRVVLWPLPQHLPSASLQLQPFGNTFRVTPQDVISVLSNPLESTRPKSPSARVPGRLGAQGKAPREPGGAALGFGWSSWSVLSQGSGFEKVPKTMHNNRAFERILSSLGALDIHRTIQHVTTFNHLGQASKRGSH